MSEERLNEIKDSIELQMQVQQAVGYKNRYDDLLIEEIDLYNEVINLQQEKQQLKEKIEQQTKICLADHKYASSKEDEVIVLTQQRDLYKEVIDELNEALNHIDDNIMKSCKNYDVNGIELKKILNKIKEN